MNIGEVSVTRLTKLREALSLLDRVGFGILLLVDQDGVLERTITDGDLRRLILAGEPIEGPLTALPPIESILVSEGTSRFDALHLMNRYLINHLPIVDKLGRPIDILERRFLDDQILLSTPHMGETERHFVEEAFLTNWIAPLGPNVDAFECELASAVGVQHAAALSSGTAALHVGLRLLGVTVGDRVFCSTFTFAASANPIVYQGAEPVFIDSDTCSWNMSPLALERAFETAKSEGWMPSAIIIVNLYGQSADMDRLLPICEHYGVPVLEDAAESLGSVYRGRPAGQFGDAGVLSFNGNKIITTGGGGALIATDPTHAARALYLATQAKDAAAPHYQHAEIGYNYRLSNVLAGIGRGQLEDLEDRVKGRRTLYRKYAERLRFLDFLTFGPTELAGFVSNRWLTTVLLDPTLATDHSPELLRQHLETFNIESRPLWKPLHQQPAFAGAPAYGGAVADGLFARGLCLPSGNGMRPADVDRVVDALLRF